MQNHEEAASANISQPAIYKHETLEPVTKNYQINSQNVEIFLDVPPTDDHYYQGINKQLPIGSSNGLAYVDDGQGSVLKIQFVKKHYGNSKPQEKSEEAGNSQPY